MSTKIMDLWNNLVVGQGHRPQVVAATSTGLAVDMAETHGQCYLEVNAGEVSDGGYTVTLEESETSGGTYTAVTFADGAIPEFTAAVDNRVEKRRFKRTKRFVRSVITESSAGTVGGVFACTLYGEKKAF